MKLLYIFATILAVTLAEDVEKKEIFEDSQAIDSANHEMFEDNLEVSESRYRYPTIDWSKDYGYSSPSVSIISSTPSYPSSPIYPTNSPNSNLQSLPKEPSVPTFPFYSNTHELRLTPSSPAPTIGSSTPSYISNPSYSPIPSYTLQPNPPAPQYTLNPSVPQYQQSPSVPQLTLNSLTPEYPSNSLNQYPSNPSAPQPSPSVPQFPSNSLTREYPSNSLPQHPLPQSPSNPSVSQYSLSQPAPASSVEWVPPYTSTENPYENIAPKSAYQTPDSDDNDGGYQSSNTASNHAQNNWNPPPWTKPQNTYNPPPNSYNPYNPPPQNPYNPPQTWQPPTTSTTTTTTTPRPKPTTTSPKPVTIWTHPPHHENWNNGYPGHTWQPQPVTPTTTTTPRPQVTIIKNEQFYGENGSYKYEYQLGDGTHVFEEGFVLNPGTDHEVLVKQGFYSHVGSDGKTYKTSYYADDTGYHAFADHLPKPHPIPPAIQASIEQNAKAEAEREEAEKKKQQQSQVPPKPIAPHPQQPTYPQHPPPTFTYPTQPVYNPYPNQPNPSGSYGK